MKPRAWPRAVILLGLAGWGSAAQGENLQQAWSLAVTQNSRLAAAYSEEDAAEHEVSAALSKRMPTLSMQGAYTLRTDERNFLVANPLVPGQTITSPYLQRDAPSAWASIGVPIYTGGQIKSSIQGAEARLMAANSNSLATRMRLLLDVGEAYLSVLKGQREWNVAERNLATLEAHEEETKSYFLQNRASQRELLAAQTAKLQAQQAKLRKTLELEIARAGYNQLLARPLDTPLELEEVAFPPLRHGYEQLRAIALEARAELQRLRSAMDAHLHEAERLRAHTRPQVSALGRFDAEENRYQTPQALGSASVIVDWSPFDGGRSRRAAHAEEARATRMAQMAAEMETRISLEVLTAWHERHEAEARLQVAAQTLAYSEEDLRVSRLRSGQGMLLGSELLDAQARQVQAAKDFYAAKYDLARGELRLRYAAGILGNGE